MRSLHLRAEKANNPAARDGLGLRLRSDVGRFGEDRK